MASNFESIYSFYYPKVYKYVFSKVSNHEIAEDITSDVFFKVFFKGEKYDCDKGAINTWIFTIAKRTIIDHYRKRKASYFDPNIIEVIGGSDSGENIQEKHENMCVIGCVLDKLSDIDKQIIFLKYFSDLSNRQISYKLGYSTGYISLLLNKTLEKIKNIYNGV